MILWQSLPKCLRETPIPPSPLTPPLSPPPPWDKRAIDLIISRLGWKRGTAYGALTPDRLTVRKATVAQTRDSARLRTNVFQRHIACTGNNTNPDLLRSFRTTVAQLWDLQWEPHHKEAFWRLINNGVIGAGGHDTVSTQSCLCGWEPPLVTKVDPQSTIAHCDSWKKHVFWQCPVAQAVVQEISTAIPSLDIQHCWLLHPPITTPPIHPTQWLPIAASALSAMQHGRKVMYTIRNAPPSPSSP